MQQPQTVVLYWIQIISFGKAWKPPILQQDGLFESN